MKYSIVIPTYNNCEKYLKPCIEAIIKYTNLDDVELIVCANGCTDNTDAYLNYVRTVVPNIKFTWDAEPLGYPRAVNGGLRLASGEKIVLLNNDAILLEQSTNTWLDMLNKPFEDFPKCGVSCIIKDHSKAAGHDFAVFFCVMIDRKVFEAIGLLNEEYGVGAGEDTEFCIEAERAGFEVREVFEKFRTEGMYTGGFPIYHVGEGTVHNPELVQNWDEIFKRNGLKLAKKYNPGYYRFLLCNNYERAVLLKGDPIGHCCERTRYEWAAKNLLGSTMFELGCTSGYGRQFFPVDVTYTGVDYDPIITAVAAEQGWDGISNTFINSDINQFELGQYDSIVAFEVIEHIDNGLEVVERFKKHCKRLLISVPHNEPQGFWGHHHRLFGLNESHFPGFKFAYINEAGLLSDTLTPIGPGNKFNLMLCRWDNE
jgi:GT2 family glycosyltransferase